MQGTKTRKEERYMIEREYLGVISVRELIGVIIRNHNGSRQSDYVETVENTLAV